MSPKSLLLLLSVPTWCTAAFGQFDADYYATTVSSLIAPLVPGERVAIDPGTGLFQAFGDGSQGLGTPFYARVYFSYDGASGCSLLGFTTDATGQLSGPGGVVFQNASEGPLALGSFANLGTFAAGTPLDFYLHVEANNCLGGGPLGVVSTQSSANTDGLADHTVQLLHHVGANGNTYLVYGFEDQPGLGDRDFNDIVFTLELVPVPEPGMIALVVVGCLCVVARRAFKSSSSIN